MCVGVCVCGCQKAHFGHYGLVQISPARVPDTYQIMYGDTFSVSICNGRTEYCNGKFSANIQNFYVTIIDADIESLKSLYEKNSLPYVTWESVNAKLEEDGESVNAILKEKKKKVLVLTPFWKRFLWHQQLSDQRYILKDYNVWLFQKLL